MSCTLATLKGILLECSNTGGLKNIWISPIDNITYDRIDLTESASAIPYTDEVNGGFLHMQFAKDLPPGYFTNTIVEISGEIDDMGTITKYSYVTPLTDKGDDYAYLDLSYFPLAPLFINRPHTILLKKVVGIYNIQGAEKFAKYSFRKGNASFKVDIPRDDKNGTSYSSTEVSMQFTKMELAKRNEIMNLISSNSYVIIEDNNGLYWFIGDGGYAAITNVSGQSGTTMSEGNFYNITLTSETTLPPYELQFYGQDKNDILT